jgi:hypothetical protein
MPVQEGFNCLREQRECLLIELTQSPYDGHQVLAIGLILEMPLLEVSKALHHQIIPPTREYANQCSHIPPISSLPQSLPTALNHSTYEGSSGNLQHSQLGEGL